MADDLTTLDEQQTTPEQFGAMEHNARWAQTFGRSSDPNRQPAPNLMRRYKKDVGVFNEGLLNEAERRQEELIRTDRTAQSFYFRSKELAAKHDLAQEAAKRATELHDFRLETERSRQAAQHALELERTAREKEIADRTTRDALSRTQLISQWDALNQSGLDGTDEFRNKTLDLLVRHGKSLDPQTRKMMTDRAAITAEDDPVESATEAMNAWDTIHAGFEKRGIHAKATWHKTPKGPYALSFTEVAAKPSPELQSLNDNLSLALSNQKKAKPSEQSKYQSGINELRSKIDTFGQPKPDLKAPAPSAGAVAAAVSEAPAKTEIIERNGVKYEVDHANKKVLRIVE